MLPIIAKKSIGNPFILLDKVDSTNSYAIDRLQANLAAHGTAYFALEQTAGKGQRGKKWQSEAGSNIILSVITDASTLTIGRQFSLSVAVALACFDLFEEYAGDETRIKWPNDIYWNDRKAAGILIENVIRGTDWKWGVVGIGMNINQTKFLPMSKRPVSLKQITGKTFDVVALGKELCDCLENRYAQLLKEDFNKLLEEYNSKLYGLNQLVKLKKGNASFACEIIGVDELGQLLIKGAAQESFDFGEVEWVI